MVQRHLHAPLLSGLGNTVLPVTEWTELAHGRVVPSLKTKPPLDGSRKNSGGVFPGQEVQDFIDGTTPVVAHGPQQMPVWG